MAKRKGTWARFWEKVLIGDIEDCWLWDSTKSRKNYGTFWLKDKKAQAHRVSFYLNNGWYPKMVCHSCDNPGCVNPNHLFGGNAKINVKDRDSKGKNPCKLGEQNQMAKLSADKVKKIRELGASGVFQREIAKKYGVSQRTIFMILSRKLWKHV